MFICRYIAVYDVDLKVGGRELYARARWTRSTRSRDAEPGSPACSAVSSCGVVKTKMVAVEYGCFAIAYVTDELPSLLPEMHVVLGLYMQQMSV